MKFFICRSGGFVCDSLLASTYIEAVAYRVLSDQSESLGDRESFDDEFGVETYEADWSAEFDDWTYRATVGVRIYLGP